MRRTYLFILLTLFTTADAVAYEQAVHRKITRSAFKLITEKNGFLIRMGLSPTDPLGYIGATPENLMADGSELEDDSWQPLNHFFDPVHRMPLRPLCRILPNQRADTWAIDG